MENKNPRCRLGLVLAAVIVSAVSSARAETRRDIEYGFAGGERLLLDASSPDGPGPFPVAILIHGGGWAHGDKSGSNVPGNPSDISPWFHTLSKANFVWFSVEYRLLNAQHPWPECFEDVETAIRWVKLHAGEFKGDPNRIALFGHSAGGNMAALALTNQTRDTRVQAGVLFAASSANPNHPGRPNTIFPRLLDATQCPPGMSQETFAVDRDPWPIDHVNSFMPPTLLVQGERDHTVPPTRTLQFLARLIAANVPIEVVTTRGSPHSIVDTTKIDPSYQAKLIVWLHETLDSPQAAGPAPDLTVAADGTGNFSTVQAALDSLPAGGQKPVVILIKEGIYRERIHVGTAGVTLHGESRRSTRIEAAPEDGDAAVVAVNAPDCVLENLSVENTRPAGPGRAVAVTGAGDRLMIADCDFFSRGTGTLELTRPGGRSYLARLNLRGAADLVSSQGACYLLDSCLYQTSSNGATLDSARGRFVLRRCFLDGTHGWHIWGSPAGSCYLLDCQLSTSIADPKPSDPRGYFYETHRLETDSSWNTDNLASAPGAPSADWMIPGWTFGETWDPELAKIPDAAAIPRPRRARQP